MGKFFNLLAVFFVALSILGAYEYKQLELNPIAKHFESKERTNWFFEWKYKKIGEALGTGANGLVFKVVKRGEENGQVYAAKIFGRGFHDDLKHEYDMMAMLDHPAIPHEHAYFHGGWFSSSVLVMDLIDGQEMW
jgi:hypothetical protein